MVRVLTGAVLLGLLLAGPAHATISLDDVIRMLEAGVSEDVIIKAIDADEARFVITSDDLIDLTQAGASDTFLEQILDRSVESQDHPSDLESSYRVLEQPYTSYASIGWVYDPFDYYFVTWPYYYGWMSPWRFQWSWWYYGGPCHHDWCHPVCYRADYYDRHWGSHAIWDRGYRDSRYHVPSYRADKDVRTASFYDRTGQGRPIRSEGKPTHVWGRPSTEGRGRSAPPRSGERSTWSRSQRPSRQSQPARPPRNREYRPDRSGWSPSQSPAPDRMSAPPRESSAPSRPARPAPAPARPRR